MRQDIPIYVVSLPRSTDRRSHMVQQATTLGLRLQLVDAVEGAALPDELRRRCAPATTRTLYGRELRAGELGCHFSHASIWAQIADGQAPFGIVLEDDVSLDDGFKRALADLASVDCPWDLIRLAGTRPRRHRVVTRTSEERALARLVRGPSGTEAYALSQAGARRLLAYSDPVVHPVDEAIDRYWESGLDTYALLPYPVRGDRRYASTIDVPLVRRRSALPEESGALRSFKRRVRRWRESLQRRWYNWRVLQLL